MAFCLIFTELDNFKICTVTQKASNSQKNFGKNKAGEGMLSDFKPYYNATVIKSSMVLGQNKGAQK